jgi:uncharacterized membrane protein HdeD (DUF308 family)
MIWGTVSTLSKEAAEAARRQMEDRRHSLRGTYRARVLVGAAIVLIGAIVFLFPLDGASFLFELALPAAVVFLGAAELFGAIFKKQEAKFVDVVIGAIVVVMGLILFAITDFEVLVVLIALSVWLLGSAFLSLRAYSSVRKVSKKEAKPKLAIGLISLAMGVGVLFLPVETFVLLMFSLGAMVMLAGAVLVASGFGLRNASKTLEASGTKAGGSVQAADR